jgi:uncharacterized protein
MVQVIRRSSFKAAPWKNGGGITHEAIRVPASGDPFRWRMSVAEIEVSGPFSDFSGYHRKMVLLKGGGVELRFASGGTQALRAVGDLAEFDGGLALECELIDGPCVDLNLIAAKDLPGVRARVARVGDPLTLRPAANRTLLAFAIDAPLELAQGGECAVLEPWDLALIPGGAKLELRAARHASAQGAALFLADLPA